MRLHLFVCRAALLTSALAGTRCVAAATTTEAKPFLPDSTVLLRVEDRITRASDFVANYFSSWPEYRPRSDSTGRVQFLKQLTDKEIMGYLAQKANRSLGFEDRATLRDYTSGVLSNVLYIRLVDDSIQVTDAELAALRQQYSWQKKFQQILFSDRQTAEKVRGDLVAKRITWKQAYAIHSRSKTAIGPEGDIGWLRREDLLRVGLSRIFDLEPQEISPVFTDADGVKLARVVERRAVEPYIFSAEPARLRDELRQEHGETLKKRVQSRLREEIGLTFDEANIAWAAAFFEEAAAPSDSGGVTTIRPLWKVPTFADRDTSRVLARWRDGRFSLAALVAAYGAINAFQRTSLHSPDQLRAKVETVVLEPYRAQLARDLGLERDPIAVAMVEKRREALLVEHLYQDSILSRARVSEADVKRYYDEHIAQFMTYPTARYAAIKTGNRHSADSLAARLRAGYSAEDILRADSIRVGGRVGRIGEMRQEADEGSPFYTTIMELKPGEVTVEPDEKQGWWVIQSLAFDSGKQLSLTQVRGSVEESARNLSAEEMLNRFLGRWRRKLRIQAHPELVMRIDLRDRSLAW